MTPEELEALLIGGTIVKVERLTELADDAWDESLGDAPFAIQLANGVVLYAMGDEEGNSAGVLQMLRPIVNDPEQAFEEYTLV